MIDRRSPNTGPVARDLPERENRAGQARCLIEDRFGDALDPEDVQTLIPYVVQILRRSARLAERVPSLTDPRGDTHLDDR